MSRGERMNGASLPRLLMNVRARKPVPPRISAPPTIFCSSPMLLSPILFESSTPTSESGIEPRNIQQASRACTVPSIRCRTAPNDLKTAPCRMSVPTATFALKPKSRIRIGVIRLPPPMPVMPTRIPTKRPASVNCQVMRSPLGRERAGDERPAGEPAAELVGLAAGAEAGDGGEQRERGDERARARCRASSPRRRRRSRRP